MCMQGTAGEWTRVPVIRQRGFQPACTSLAAALACMVVLSAGCASSPVTNARLDHFNQTLGYRIDNLSPGEHNSDSLLVIVTFSGGGHAGSLLRLRRPGATTRHTRKVGGRRPLPAGRSRRNLVGVRRKPDGGILRSIWAAHLRGLSRESALQEHPGHARPPHSSAARQSQDAIAVLYAHRYPGQGIRPTYLRGKNIR